MNPRLTDQLNLAFTQDDVPFAIPHLREDLPLAVDPFLFWKSEDATRVELHPQLVAFFDSVRALALAGQRYDAAVRLLRCSEARELGLGYGLGTKAGSAIGPKLADSILDAFESVPQLAEGRLTHVEMLGLIVPLIGEDRISDLAASVLKSFFVQYTRDQASALSIPVRWFHLNDVWDPDKQEWRPLRTELPYNPLDNTPLLFAPLDVLRHLPWINYDDYYRSSYSRLVVPPDRAHKKVAKTAVLEYNRRNFVAVERYVEHKEHTAPACQPDPLFQPLKRDTLAKKLADLRRLPPGKEDGADKSYESLAFDLLSSLLYPELEFAASQVRTVSGAHIRDIIFYNDGKDEFLADVRARFDARQIVFELKNVKSLSTENVNQLYRYLDEEFGRFGVLVTRNPAPKPVQTNIVDLHSSKRCVILVVDDGNLELMLSLVGSHRRPADALEKRFIEFTRLLPK